MEGSAFNGLQSIAFRKPYADNSTVGGSEVAKLDVYIWGFREEKELRENGAKRIIRQAHELLDILEEA